MGNVEKAAEQFADAVQAGPWQTAEIWHFRKAAFLAGAAWQRERDAEICNRERMRQIKGERLEKMNGADTAFALMKTIRESFDENKDG